MVIYNFLLFFVTYFITIAQAFFGVYRWAGCTFGGYFPLLT